MNWNYVTGTLLIIAGLIGLFKDFVIGCVFLLLALIYFQIGDKLD